MTDEFRAFEHEGWQLASGNYDEAWSGLVQPFIPYLLDDLDVGPGTRLLDVACGPGYVAEAAHALGATATGLDFSPEMISIARERSPGIEFREGDALALPFSDDSFDVVAINFGVLHLADPGQAFVEARRVLRPRGCLGFTVWAPPEMSPGAAIIHEAIDTHAEPDESLPQGPAYFGFGTPEECREGLGVVGFDPDSLVFRTVTVEWTVPTASFVFESERDAGVRTGVLLRDQSPETLEAIRAEVEKRMQDFATDEGYTVPYAAHVITICAH